MMTKKQARQLLVEKYREAGNPWPASTHDIAVWAVQNKLWLPEQSAIIAQCASELADAMREEYYTDNQGRKVRAKHAAKVVQNGEQTMLWDDMRTAPPEHMRAAFSMRRNQIFGDVKQLKTDVDSYNENRSPSFPLQISFDFGIDLEEEAARLRAKAKKQQRGQ